MGNVIATVWILDGADRRRSINTVLCPSSLDRSGRDLKDRLGVRDDRVVGRNELDGELGLAIRRVWQNEMQIAYLI